MKKVQDHYFHKAKKEGYVARSAYKLEEIDKKHRILKRGNRVLDLGCAPGSWLQYISKKVGNSGNVWGIDLQRITISLPEQVIVRQGDIFDLQDNEDLWSTAFDVIVSDMAPKTTGIRSVDSQRSMNLNEHVLHLAAQHLSPHGSLLVKAFQGEHFSELHTLFKNAFHKVQLCKPKSSRNESVELFILGRKKKPQDSSTSL